MLTYKKTTNSQEKPVIKFEKEEIPLRTYWFIKENDDYDSHFAVIKTSIEYEIGCQLDENEIAVLTKATKLI